MGKAQAHKEELVRTAMRLFRRQGYASTGLNQILEESGAPKGSLYYYFPKGKEALAAAAVDLAGSLMREKLEELAEGNPKPTDFLRAYCDVLADWMAESGYRSGCPIATTLLETAPSSPEITEAGARAIDSWIEVIARVHVASGMKPKQARTRAEGIIAAIEGALILSRVRQSREPILALADWI